MVFQFTSPNPRSTITAKTGNWTKNSNMHKKAQKNTKSQNEITHLIHGKIESIIHRKIEIYVFCPTYVHFSVSVPVKNTWIHYSGIYVPCRYDTLLKPVVVVLKF
jgi:hypothetical protein